VIGERKALKGANRRSFDYK